MPTAQTISSTPLITFIITAYNLPPDLLKTCVESIERLSLAMKEHEIILVDDGSDIPAIDNLPDHADHITYIRQAHQGLSAARNMGLRCATGQYIQFVDGDDYLIQAPYGHCLDIVRYQNADIVIFHETSNNKPSIPLEYDGPISGVTYMHRNNLRASTCGYIFRRSILGSLRFTSGRLHEDEEFTPQLMLRAERVFSTSAEAYFYRKRPESIMSKKSKRHVAKRLSDMVDIILKLQSVANSGPEIDRVALNRRVAQLSMDYLYNTIKLTHSRKHLEEAVDTLRRHGLFPLPKKNYTKKYTTFRALVGNPIGRRILLATIR